MRLGLFAKYWEPGHVKTRLAASVGQQIAAEVYRTFVQHLIRFAGFPDEPHIHPEIVYSPPGAETAFREIARQFGGEPGWSFHPQGSGDLGERMHRFFERTFQQGYSRGMILGTDSPTMPLKFVNQAYHLLRLHDVVLGPTEDGGYYLVAARNRVPEIFADISWSTNLVWKQTVAKLQQHHVNFAVLPTWYDVDRGEDLTRLRNEIDQVRSKTAGTDDYPNLSTHHLAVVKLGKALDHILSAKQ